MKKILNYIDGRNVSISNLEGDVYDPSTGEVISKVVFSNKDDFNKVIQSSKKSQLDWENTTPLKRSRIIYFFLMIE